MIFSSLTVKSCLSFESVSIQVFDFYEKNMFVRKYRGKYKSNINIISTVLMAEKKLAQIYSSYLYN